MSYETRVCSLCHLTISSIASDKLRMSALLNFISLTSLIIKDDFGPLWCLVNIQNSAGSSLVFPTSIRIIGCANISLSEILKAAFFRYPFRFFVTFAL